MVARLTPDQKAACSNHVKVSCAIKCMCSSTASDMTYRAFVLEQIYGDVQYMHNTAFSNNTKSKHQIRKYLPTEELIASMFNSV